MGRCRRYATTGIVVLSTVALLVYGLATPKRSYALIPQALAFCMPEGSALAGGLATPVAIIMGGTMGLMYGGFTLGPALTPLLYAILCEGDSISMAIGQLETSEHRVATTKLHALDTVADKSFAENAIYDKQLKEGANNLPAGACDEVYRASNSGQANSTAAQEALALNSQFSGYNLSAPPTGSALAAQLSVTPGSLTPLSIFGAGDLASGGTVNQTVEGRQYIINATNPIPAPPPSPSLIMSPSGGKILAKSNMDIASVSMSQKTLADVLALHAPVIDLSAWQTGILGATGAVTPSVSTAGNNTPTTKSSVMAIIGQAVQARFSNPTYLQGIFAINSATRQVLQSMAATQAVDLEIEYQTLLAEQNQEAVLAEILARMVNADHLR